MFIRPINLLLLFLLATNLSSCSLFERRDKGCIDPDALNFDRRADEDDGSCEFSKVSFFIRGTMNGPPLEVFLDGRKIGTLPGIVFFDRPGNCSTSNTVTTVLQDRTTHDWEASVPGQTAGTSGTVSANSEDECIFIEVLSGLQL